MSTVSQVQCSHESLESFQKRQNTIEGLRSAAALALKGLDLDPDREGLKDTPLRWAKSMFDLTHGHEFLVTTFAAEGCSQMVMQSDIQFYSLCEHHLVPFFGTATVAYIPKDKIIGISKLARTVEHFSKRLQVQERMTDQIADFLQEKLDPLGVGVILRARHLCQEMRGIKKTGAQTQTSALRGEFLEDAKVRSEFFSLERSNRNGN